MRELDDDVRSCRHVYAADSSTAGYMQDSDAAAQSYQLKTMSEMSFITTWHHQDTYHGILAFDRKPTKALISPCLEGVIPDHRMEQKLRVSSCPLGFDFLPSTMMVIDRQGLVTRDSQRQGFCQEQHLVVAGSQDLL